ncbi:MAG: hypothetical protein ACXVUL_12460 [Solirubrobacteraceae bacterium]|jgi:hypothetical protein
MVKRASWLSVTPEPERELPEAVAALRHGHRPPAEAVTAERERIERLVLRGSQREWLAYLHDVVGLIEQTRPSDSHVSRARARAAAVLANHHNLLLGLPGRAAERTASDRARLSRLAADLPRHPE